MITPLEAMANASSLASILLAGRNSIHTWWTGILSVCLFFALFFKARLYADMSLQVFFLVTSILGWYFWSRRNAVARNMPAGESTSASSPKNSVEHSGSPIRRTPLRLLIPAILIAAPVTFAWAWFLKRHTNAAAPLPDSAVLALSILAQLLLMGRRLENWPLWLAVNTISVPLYFSRGLHLTAALYAAYWVNAVLSWAHWARLYRAQDSSAANPRN